MMKTYEYGVDCWQGYTNRVKELVKRELTRAEYPVLLQSYIHGETVEVATNKLNGGQSA
jgi:hypothetical protein